jgi:hypothetical protein
LLRAGAQRRCGDLWRWDRGSGRVTMAGTKIGLVLYGLTGGR